MTPSEAKTAFTDNRRAYSDSVTKLLPLVKAAAFVLKDVNQPSLAREIDAQLYVIETLDAELQAAVTTNPRAFVESMLDGLR